LTSVSHRAGRFNLSLTSRLFERALAFVSNLTIPRQTLLAITAFGYAALVTVEGRLALPAQAVGSWFTIVRHQLVDSRSRSTRSCATHGRAGARAESRMSPSSCIRFGGLFKNLEFGIWNLECRDSV